MKPSLARSRSTRLGAVPARPTTLLARLIDAPDLVRIVRALPPPAFSALVRYVGVEDAGEIVALATTEQLVAAFDEDLFGNDRPGERETFDAGRFAAWLEVLLEAGDDVAASRITELSEDFVVNALASLVLVLDHEALLLRMSEDDDDARLADKALENALSEELDGYLVLAKRPEAWDAALALVLALDRDHRALLERLLDRCADLASEYAEDLEALSSVLNGEASLAEDVEAEREARRSREGHVEPRAARAFLALAPKSADRGGEARDPITRAYFRELEPSPFGSHDARDATEALRLVTGDALHRLDPALLGATAAALPGAALDAPPEAEAPLARAMRRLAEVDAQVFDARMRELAYLANVLVAGAEIDGRRFRADEAARAVLATVALGAELEARRGRARTRRRATDEVLADVLRAHPADLLFRGASRALAAVEAGRARAFVRDEAELDAELASLGARISSRG